MTFDELCTLAGNGRHLPRSVLPLERVTYRGLTWLYHAYRRGAFSKDEAAEEKEALRREYEEARRKRKGRPEALQIHRPNPCGVRRTVQGCERKRLSCMQAAC